MRRELSDGKALSRKVAGMKSGMDDMISGLLAAGITDGCGVYARGRKHTEAVTRLRRMGVQIINVRKGRGKGMYRLQDAFARDVLLQIDATLKRRAGR